MTLDGFRDEEQDVLNVVDDLPFVYKRWEEPYMMDLSISKWRTSTGEFYEVK